MKAIVLLADAAQAINNKLYILGGGWSVTNPTTSPFSIAVKVAVPADESEKKHRWELRLLEATGEPARVGSTEEEVKLGGEFEVGPGPHPELDADLCFAITITPLPLRPSTTEVRGSW